MDRPVGTESLLNVCRVLFTVSYGFSPLLMTLHLSLATHPAHKPSSYSLSTLSSLYLRAFALACLSAGMLFPREQATQDWLLCLLQVSAQTSPDSPTLFFWLPHIKSKLIPIHSQQPRPVLFLFPQHSIHTTHHMPSGWILVPLKYPHSHPRKLWIS